MGSITGRAPGGNWPRFVFWAVLAALSVGLLTFSQTVAWFGHEGFYLLAAQLINAGKRPYVDFFYAHPPLYPYLNAAWMRVFGETWRSAHVLSALLTGASIVLVAGFVFTRFREPAWRLAGGVAAALLMGLHLHVLRFGTVAMPYGLCLFLSVASFRLVTEAMDRPRGFLPLWAGLCAGAAAAASRLAAPVGPLLFLWMVWHNRTGDRMKRCAQFLGGAAISFLPLLWLAVQAPRQVLFDIVEYQHYYFNSAVPTRVLTLHNLKVFQAWLNSTQDFLLVLLAAVGLLFLRERSEWDARQRAEFYLCAWLTGGLGVYLASYFPTFPHYFVLLIPFLSILASVGVYAIGSRVWNSTRPGWLVLGLLGLFAVGLAKSAYQQRLYLHPYWREIEAFAREVNRVTPSDGLVYANEATYFAARRLPPPGLENQYTLDLNLPPAFAASMHIVPQAQVDNWLAQGRFATVWIGADDPRVESLGLLRLYARRKEVKKAHIFGDCYIFWDRVARSREPS